MKCSLDTAGFLEEISSLSPSIVFLYFFSLFSQEGLISSRILCNSAFSWVYLYVSPLPFPSFLSLGICRPSQTTALPSCFSFSLGWLWSLPPIQHYKPLSIVLWAFCLHCHASLLYFFSCSVYHVTWIIERLFVDYYPFGIYILL